MAPEVISLPVVNLSPENFRDQEKKRLETEKLLDCFSSVGFCKIRGVEGYDEEELLKWSKWFFYEVPEEVKMEQLATRSFNPKNKNGYRGYFPLVPGGLSHKHGYDIGQDWPDLSPEEKENPLNGDTPKLNLPGREDEVEEFYKVIFHHRSVTRAASDLIMRLLAEAGEESSDYFEPMFGDHPMSNFRPLHYPKRLDGEIPDQARLPDDRVISTPEHLDSGFLTLLQTFHFPGLEIRVDGKWYAVESDEKNEIVVNLGEQMTAMSNGRFKATIHRVIDIGMDRFSIPFFYEPGCDANINVKMPKKLLPESTRDGQDPNWPSSVEMPYYPFATFLLNKLPVYTEYAALADNLPEWVREKYLYKYSKLGCWAMKEGVLVDQMTYATEMQKEVDKSSIEA